ncbi:MAG: M61 family metallopeptidase [Vulcanimicrobiaceae bacterium]
MNLAVLRAALGAAVVSGLVLALTQTASAAQPIDLTVDASLAPTQNIVRTHEVVPVSPGKMTLYYPQWIPGEHGPAGPIQNVAGLQIKANGRVIPWKRQPFNLFAFDLDVPQGASAIDVDFTYLGATFGRYSSNRLSSPNIFVIDWNQNVLYPSTGTFADTTFNPTLILPGKDWKYATALYDAKRSGNAVSWSTTSLERLMDSPLDACTNFRKWELWKDTGTFPGTATLNVCADIPEELQASSKVVDHYKALVREMIVMYGARHWHDYHFLLTVSDSMPGEGVEHHESSDDGEGGNYLIDSTALERGGDLLSHEFNHSWDGKYRMPAGLYPKNPNLPFDDELLWVYEGMTQYYGDVMSFRDGIRDAKNWPDHVARIWASFDTEQGRLWRPLDDTAVSGPFLYGSPRLYVSERRSVDFYAEGELLWLKADAIIRQLSNNQKSLDTFARAFFGQDNTGPVVKTYTRDDVIAGLNAVQPYDWAGFFHKWVDDIAVHPPDGFTDDGWKFEYTSKPSHDVHQDNFTFSVGFQAPDGMVSDVDFGSPAYKAGLDISSKIVAVNGRTYSSDLMFDAIEEAQKTHRPIELTVVKDNIYRTISISYFDGPKYPHLVKVDAAKAGRLDDVVKPQRKM